MPQETCSPPFQVSVLLPCDRGPVRLSADSFSLSSLPTHLDVCCVDRMFLSKVFHITAVVDLHSDCDAISCSLENARVHKLHKSRSRLTDNSSEFPEKSHFVIIGLKNHPRVIISECIEYISSMGQLKKCSYGWAVFDSKS